MKSQTRVFKAVILLFLISVESVVAIKEKSASSLSVFHKLHETVASERVPTKKVDHSKVGPTTPLLSTTDGDVASNADPEDITIKLYVEITLSELTKVDEALKKAAEKLFNIRSLNRGIKINYNKGNKKWHYEGFLVMDQPDSKDSSGKLQNSNTFQKNYDASSKDVQNFIEKVGVALGKVALHWIFKNIGKAALLAAFPAVAPIVIAYNIYKSVFVDLNKLKANSDVWNLKVKYNALDMLSVKVNLVLELVFASTILTRISEAWEKL